MTTQTEALKLALDALTDGDHWEKQEAIIAIKEALEQPEQEPVGVVGTDLGGTHLMYGSQYVGKTPDKKTAIFFKDVPSGSPLYTTPPQRKPLTRKEVLAIIDKHPAEKKTGLPMFYRDQALDIARAIEAAHGIKE